jgi:hypothetical protein
MIPADERLLDSATSTFHALRSGKVPPPITVPDDLPDNELRQLIVFINRFLVEYAPFVEAMERMSEPALVPGSGGRQVEDRALAERLQHVSTTRNDRGSNSSGISAKLFRSCGIMAHATGFFSPRLAQQRGQAQRKNL